MNGIATSNNPLGIHNVDGISNYNDISDLRHLHTTTQNPPNTGVHLSNPSHSHYHSRPTPYSKPSRVSKRPLDVLPDSLNIDATISKMDSLYNTQFYLWIKNPQNREYAALRVRPLVDEYNNLSHTAHVLRWITADWKLAEAKDLFRLVTEKWEEAKRRLLDFHLVKAQREEEGLLVKKRRRVIQVDPSLHPRDSSNGGLDRGNGNTQFHGSAASAPATPMANRHVLDLPLAASSPPYSPDSPRWRLATSTLQEPASVEPTPASPPAHHLNRADLSRSSRQYPIYPANYVLHPHAPTSPSYNPEGFSSPGYSPRSPVFSPASPTYSPDYTSTNYSPSSPSYSAEYNSPARFPANYALQNSARSSPPYSPDTPPSLSSYPLTPTDNVNYNIHYNSLASSPVISERKITHSPQSTSPILTPHRVVVVNSHRLS